MYKILIKRFRNIKRMNQKDLSKKCGLSISYISRLEANNSIRDRTPSLQSIESLAISLNVCVNSLVFYPCIECNQNETCTKKEKDMRNPNIIADEIVNHYI